MIIEYAFLLILIVASYFWIRTLAKTSYEKEYTIFFLIFCLLVCGFSFSSSWASSPHHRIIARNNDSAASSCPSGTYLFAWDGDYTGDTDKGCFASGGTTKDGSLSGTAALHTDWGESGSVGVAFPAANDDLSWAVSSKDGLDPAQGTIYIRIKAVTTANTNTVFIAWGDASNYILIDIINSNEVRGTYVGAGSTDYDYSSSTVTDNTWTTIGFSWKADEAGTDFSVTHDRTNWNDKDKDLAVMNGTDPASIKLISEEVDDVYIDRIVITSGFKDSLPGWW